MTYSIDRRQVHWALSLFAKIKHVGASTRLVWKQMNDGVSNASTPRDFYSESVGKVSIDFVRGAAPVPGGWYNGDRIKTSMDAARTVGSKDPITIRHPTYNETNGATVVVEYRRLSQLLPFERLTRPCQIQDEPQAV